jgi:hypothetical protein
MSFADALQKVIEKVNEIPGIGVDVTYQRVSTDSYSTTTGQVTESSVNTTVKGVFTDVNNREANDLIQAGDRKCMVAANSLSNVPTTFDRIVYGGVTYQVISVKTVSQAGIDLSYEFVLRA